MKKQQRTFQTSPVVTPPVQPIVHDDDINIFGLNTSSTTQLQEQVDSVMALLSTTQMNVHALLHTVQLKNEEMVDQRRHQAAMFEYMNHTIRQAEDKTMLYKMFLGIMLERYPNESTRAIETVAQMRLQGVHMFKQEYDKVHETVAKMVNRLQIESAYPTRNQPHGFLDGHGNTITSVEIHYN